MQPRAVKAKTKFKLNLLVDSGAFTVFKKGISISLLDYLHFLEQVEDERPGRIFYAVNLDVIPGKFGAQPSPQTIEDAAKESYANLKEMRKSGLPVLPVFHRGERLYWLEKMIEDGHDYIGLGGIANSSLSVRKAWLDEVFSFLCGSKGYPQVRLHGFGVNSVPIVMRYPWFSVDTQSWLARAANGSFLLPKKVHDGYDYTLPSELISVTKRRAASAPRETYWGAAKTLVAQVDAYLAMLGPDFRIEQLCRSLGLLGAANASFIANFDKQLRITPFSSVGFRAVVSGRGQDDPIAPRLTTFCVTHSSLASASAWQNWGLDRVSVANRLVSFALVKQGGSLAEYIDESEELSVNMTILPPEFRRPKNKKAKKNVSPRGFDSTTQAG